MGAIPSRVDPDQTPSVDGTLITSERDILALIPVLDGCANGVFCRVIRMSKTAYRPLIEPKLRTSVPRKVMREAVQKIASLRKTNPAAYRALIDKHAKTTIRIVPG